MPFDVFQPGPHYIIAGPDGDYLVAYPELALDTRQEAEQHLRELAADGIDTTDGRIVSVAGGFWLARCSACGEVAGDGYVYADFHDVVQICGDVNQVRSELWWRPLPPYWFVSHEHEDVRCVHHAPDGYLAAWWS